MALHYRHLSTQIARHQKSKPLEQIALDRARAHVVSSQDPVTGGVHCAIGGDDYSFIVTSTLASQCPPAVGRALGSNWAHQLGVASKFEHDFVSYVSMGDGSINNAHALSAINLAKYAQHRGLKCPLVFAISNNELCISLRDEGWLSQGCLPQLGLRTFEADGSNLASVWRESEKAIHHARTLAEPVFLLFNNLPRRFGHAATDRQSAYMSEAEISHQAARNPLAGLP